MNFLGPTDVTNDECLLNGLNKLVSIVSQLIIQIAKSPKVVCWNKNIDVMRNTTGASLNIGLSNSELFSSYHKSPISRFVTNRTLVIFLQ